MSSAPDLDALPYAQRLRALLHDQRLPNVVNLGKYNRVDGKLVQQEGFVEMTAEEVLQLARQLQAHPNVTHLNLSGNFFGADGMRELAGPIDMLTGLQALDLQGTGLCLLLLWGWSWDCVREGVFGCLF